MRRSSITGVATCRRLVPALLSALALAACFDPQYRDDLACGTHGECPPGYHCADGLCRPGEGTDDGGQTKVDAAANLDAAPGPDAPANQPDAAPGQPDAAPGTPDAAGGTPDAAGGTPDAAGGTPDAAPGTPDAAPPPDAPVDAAPPPDARPDAMPVGCTGDPDCLSPPDLCHLAGTCNLTTHECSFPDVDCSSLDGECQSGVCQIDDGSCVAAPANEAQLCGAPESCSYGACGGFSDTCDESGSQSGTCTDHVCMAGTCAPRTVPSTVSCTRNTDDDPCGADVCGAPYGTCVYEGDPVCDTTGSRTATCTPRVCSGGLCGDGTPYTGTDTAGCDRTTSGTECQAKSCTCGACTYATCHTDGTKSCDCTHGACSGDSCDVTASTENQSCTRPSQEGLQCQDPVQTCDDCYPYGDCENSESVSCVDTTYTCQGTDCIGEASGSTKMCDTRDSTGVPCATLLCCFLQMCITAC